MVATIRAGAAYFGIVFSVGFVLGPIRLLWAVPRFGERTAELLEMPLMLVAIVLAARWTVRRWDNWSAGRLAAVGVLALGLLLMAEVTLVLALGDLSIAEYLAGRDPVSGTVYAISLVLFAAMPCLVRRYVSEATGH